MKTKTAIGFFTDPYHGDNEAEIYEPCDIPPIGEDWNESGEIVMGLAAGRMIWSDGLTASFH